MSSIKNKIMDRLVQPSSREVTTITTVAKVTASDEINNKCSIVYIDKNGIKRNRDNVVVRLYDNGSGVFSRYRRFCRSTIRTRSLRYYS